ERWSAARPLCLRIHSREVQVKLRLLSLGLAACALMSGTTASAQEPYLGEVRLFGFNFCPTGWVPADGRGLPIPQYTALLALYGGMSGGNGQNTFGIPNLQGKAPTGATGTQPPGTAYGGSATLATANLPPMHVQVFGSNASATVASPAGALPGVAQTGQ